MLFRSLEPCDPVQLRSVIAQTTSQRGIFYIRLMRKTKEQFYEEGAVFRLGKASILREGKDLSIITCGTICIKEALKAADALGAEGIQTKIIDMFTIKPLDREAVIKAATGTDVYKRQGKHLISQLLMQVGGCQQDDRGTFLNHSVHDSIELLNGYEVKCRYCITSDRKSTRLNSSHRL